MSRKRPFEKKKLRTKIFPKYQQEQNVLPEGYSGKNNVQTKAVHSPEERMLICMEILDWWARTLFSLY